MRYVVADESSRVFLQPIRAVDGSDYINASFIDVSYSHTHSRTLGWSLGGTDP